jgi:hypothetical protein
LNFIGTASFKIGILKIPFQYHPKLRTRIMTINVKKVMASNNAVVRTYGNHYRNGKQVERTPHLKYIKQKIFITGLYPKNSNTMNHILTVNHLEMLLKLQLCVYTNNVKDQLLRTVKV